MNYAEIKTNDIANGEGVRTSLFVSGCRHHCPDCFNYMTWDFAFGNPVTQGGREKNFKATEPDWNWITGLTVLGGEPFEPENQPVLLDFLKEFKEKFPEKNIWCYSGFTFEEITGKTDAKLVDFLLPCVTVQLESNHDEDMLARGKYPPVLKRRVGGNRGHLSNRQAAELVLKMHSVGVKRVLLGHLSQNNNTPELAFYTTVQKLKENGITESVDITVDVVTQDNKSGVFLC